LTSNDRAASSQLCELSHTQSFTLSRILVGVASNGTSVGLAVAFVCVLVTPDDWVLLISRVCVWVDVH
jgi:hypothetical protein